MSKQHSTPFTGVEIGAEVGLATRFETGGDVGLFTGVDEGPHHLPLQVPSQCASPLHSHRDFPPSLHQDPPCSIPSQLP